LGSNLSAFNLDVVIIADLPLSFFEVNPESYCPGPIALLLSDLFLKLSLLKENADLLGFTSY